MSPSLDPNASRLGPAEDHRRTRRRLRDGFDAAEDDDVRWRKVRNFATRQKLPDLQLQPHCPTAWTRRASPAR